MLSELPYEAGPGEITRFLIATNGFVAFMRTRHGTDQDAKAHSRDAKVFVGRCPVLPDTIENMIADGLLTFAGCESMTGEGILEYYEPTDKAKSEVASSAP